MRPLFVVLVFLVSGRAPQEGTIVAPSTMDALDQPGGKQPVFQVQQGQSYPLVKRGGPGKAWCKLSHDGKQGWIPCDHSAAPDERTPAQDNARCATTCSHAPLFKDLPELTATDREVLGICPARPDASVSRGDVQRFIAAHYSDPRIQRALSAAGRPGNREANIEWLTSLWVSTGPRNAFTHVFCGDDWQGDKLGGLHWLPRYAQLEHDGKICFEGPVKGNTPVQGGQYLIRYKGLAPWSCAHKKVGGFPVTHDPVDTLAVATRAFVRCCERSGQRKEGGVYAAPDVGPTRWRIWCNSRNGTYGIASLYPTDEKPTCAE